MHEPVVHVRHRNAIATITIALASCIY